MTFAVFGGTIIIDGLTIHYKEGDNLMILDDDFVLFQESEITNSKICPECSKQFEFVRNGAGGEQIYCSTYCRNKAKRIRQGMDLQPREFSTGDNAVAIGTIAELLVCSDLLKNGFDVFRSISAASKFDLVAVNKDGNLWKIEVKRAVKTTNLRFVECSGNYNKCLYQVDIYAFVVIETQEIFYYDCIGRTKKISDSRIFWHTEEKIK